MNVERIGKELSLEHKLDVLSWMVESFIHTQTSLFYLFKVSYYSVLTRNSFF